MFTSIRFLLFGIDFLGFCGLRVHGKKDEGWTQ